MIIPSLLSSLASYVSRPSGQTTFSKLSQEAQDAIVWAATMTNGDEQPPQLTDSVREEISTWASEPEPLADYTATSRTWTSGDTEYREHDGYIEARNALNPEWVVVDKA